MLVGVGLMAAFVWHAFRPEHPLLDLRLFKNRNLTVTTITMFLFAAAFFGGLLLVPTYFQEVRGESTLAAGLLVAPQGIGAMITMPIAGTLVDKFPVGRIVPFGLALITIGMFGFTQIEANTSYTLLLGLLFIMGLGMGGTMMPLFTTALRTLKNHEVARGSTLLNITQQIASSVGVAVISVVLTNHLKDAPLAHAGDRRPAGSRGGRPARRRWRWHGDLPRRQMPLPAATGWRHSWCCSPSSRCSSCPANARCRICSTRKACHRSSCTR